MDADQADASSLGTNIPTVSQGWALEITGEATPLSKSNPPPRKLRPLDGISSNDVSLKVFIGGISWQAQESDLSEFFSQYGTVTDSKIIRDPLTGKSKGYGFVTFATEAIASSVKQIGFVELLGRKCQVGDAVRGIGRSRETGNSGPPSGAGSGGPQHPVGSTSQLPYPISASANNSSQQSLPPAAPAERRVFVGGLPRQLNESSLHCFFSQWGPVSDAKIIYDSKRTSKGYGFITFLEAQTAALVKSYRTVQYMGRVMNVGDAVRGLAGAAPNRGPTRIERGPRKGRPGSPTPYDGLAYPRQAHYHVAGEGPYGMYPGYPGYGPMEYVGGGYPVQGFPGGYPGYESPPYAGVDYSGMQGYHGGHAPYPMQQAAQATRLAMPIPCVAAEAVVAKGGEQLKHICQISGAQVALVPVADEGADRVLEIAGTQQQIESAQNQLQMLFSRGLPSEIGHKTPVVSAPAVLQGNIATPAPAVVSMPGVAASG